MDIVVLVKQTFDTEAKIELAGDAIVSDGVKKILNPYDEYAVEEAVRLKEKNGGTVTAVGIGGKEFEDVLRHVLAMGCDASVVIDDPAVLAADAAGRAAALAAAVRKLPYDLILCGQTVIDSGTGEVAVRVAEKSSEEQARGKGGGHHAYKRDFLAGSGEAALLSAGRVGNHCGGARLLCACTPLADRHGRISHCRCACGDPRCARAGVPAPQAFKGTLCRHHACLPLFRFLLLGTGLCHGYVAGGFRAAGL